MNYILKYFDKNLIKFEFDINLRGISQVKILKIYKENQTFFPLNLELDNDIFLSWIKSRTIPKNREFVLKILKALNLDFNQIEWTTKRIRL